MHSAVLQSKKYIGFSEKNTVEVISLSRLAEGIEKGDPKAATYTARGPEGDEVEFLVKYPGMTVEDMQNVRRSRATSYNRTGKIPYTAIVNPHTLEEMRGFSGGQSSKTLMEAVMEARRELTSEYGQAISRQDYRLLRASGDEVQGLVGDGEFKKALRLVDDLSKKSHDWPQDLQERVTELRTRIFDAAKERLADIRGRADSDPSDARRELRKLARELHNTPIADEAEELMDSIG